MKKLLIVASIALSIVGAAYFYVKMGKKAVITGVEVIDNGNARIDEAKKSMEMLNKASDDRAKEAEEMMRK